MRKPADSETDFRKLVAEMGYVRARRGLRHRELTQRQTRVHEADEQALRKQLHRRLEEAIRLSSTLGEPSPPSQSVQREDGGRLEGETEDDARRRLTAEHALRRGLLLPDQEFLAPQLRMTSLPAEIGTTLFVQLGDLRRMNVQRNDLTSLLELSLPQLSMYTLRELNHLNISGNKLTTLPSEMGVLTKLRHLDASFNNISKLPLSMSQLSSLESCNLSGNSLSSLEEWFSSLSHLNRLDLSKNLFSAMPFSLCKLGKLQILDMSSNSLNHFAFLPPNTPSSDLWVEVRQPGKRTIYRNVITQELVEEISDQSDVAIEQMECLHVFQPRKSEHYQLRKLWLSICKVPEWEAVVDSNSGWTYFQNNVSGESTWDLPDSLDLIGKLGNLNNLVLNRNNLRTLPSSVTKLSHLSRLSVAHNRLKSLCRGWSGLRKLTILHLQFNELKSLPVSLEHCYQLNEIDIQGNSLTKLPDGIGFLPNLQRLNANSNCISRIPYSFGYSKELVELFLENNPLIDPPLEVASKPISEVKWVLRQKFLIDQRGPPPAVKLHRIGILGEVEVHSKELTNMLKMQLEISVCCACLLTSSCSYV